MKKIINLLDSTLSSLKCRIEADPKAVKLHQFTSSVPVGPWCCMTLRTLRFSLLFLYSSTSNISSTECLMIYAAHIKIPKSDVFKVHLSLKGDTGLTGRPGPVGPPGVGEPGFMVCLFFCLVRGKQDRKQKFYMLPHKNVC